MGWEVIKPGFGLMTPQINVMIAYNKQTKGAYKIIISMPEDLCKKLGWKVSDKILVARGTGEDYGVIRLTRSEKNSFALRRVNKHSTKYRLGMISWLKLPEKPIKAKVCDYQIINDPQPALSIDLPDWLIDAPVGDMGKIRPLFKNQAGLN